MMKRKIWVSILILGCFVALIAYQLSNLQLDIDTIRIPANEPRPWTQKYWVEMTEDSVMPPSFSEMSFFSSHAITASGPNTLEVAPGHPDLISPFKSTEENLVEIEAIGIGLPHKRMSMEPKISTDARNVVYDASGKNKLTGAELKALPLFRKNAPSNGYFPRVTLYYKSKTPLRIEKQRIVHSKRKVSLNSGWGTRTEGNRYSTSSDINTWSGTNLQVILEICSVENTWVDLVPSLSEKATNGDQTVKIVKIVDDLNLGSGFSMSGSIPQKTYIPVNAPTGTPERATGVFVAAYPFSSLGELQFRVHNNDGTTEDARSQTIRHFGYLLSFKQPLADIEKIEVGFPKAYHRVFLDLPSLPELPKENESLDDLLEQRIPFVQLRPKQRNYFVNAAGGFHFENHLPDRNALNNLDSMRYENVTLRNVLREHLADVPTGVPTSFDKEEFRLKIGTPSNDGFSWSEFWDRIF